MSSLKRTIAALMLAFMLALGVGTASAQSHVVGSWWVCVDYWYIPLWGWVEFASFAQYMDGATDPSSDQGAMRRECTLIMLCFGDGNGGTTCGG